MTMRNLTLYCLEQRFHGSINLKTEGEARIFWLKPQLENTRQYALVWVK